MNTRRLRRFLAELEELRDRHRYFDDEQGAERIDEVLERVRELVRDVDRVLSRLGNPPTDP